MQAGADAVADPDEVASIVARVGVIRERVSTAGGDPDRVTIVAVTKAFDVGVVQAALGAGLVNIGENYAQELIDKVRSLDPGELERVRVHFVGRLQRNKVKAIAPFVDLWQSVDRKDLGDEIAKRAPGAAVLVQVNSTGEAQKGGCAVRDVSSLVQHLRERGLDVRGLMAVGLAGDSEGTRRAFAEVSAIADDLDLIERSMGMSEDLEIAVQEGATMVRIGRDLFGPRQRSNDPGRVTNT